jgi:hypothetical protein
MRCSRAVQSVPSSIKQSEIPGQQLTTVLADPELIVSFTRHFLHTQWNRSCRPASLPARRHEVTKNSVTNTRFSTLPVVS